VKKDSSLTSDLSADTNQSYVGGEYLHDPQHGFLQPRRTLVSESDYEARAGDMKRPMALRWRYYSDNNIPLSFARPARAFCRWCMRLGSSIEAAVAAQTTPGR